MNTVTIPVIINVAVAIKDRIDRRALPQTPCPLVHPLPSCVPSPTKTPARIKKDPCTGNVTSKSSSFQKETRVGPKINPIKKDTRQSLSFFVAVNNPPKIPLMPAIRPTDHMRKTAESPIKAPPTLADIGVKFSNANSYLMLSWHLKTEYRHQLRNPLSVLPSQRLSANHHLDPYYRNRRGLGYTRPRQKNGHRHYHGYLASSGTH